jgi:hypothetical protein
MRWYGLARFPFEQDELYTLQESRELFQTTLLPGIDARPLYYLLHHALMPFLQHGELGARLPAFAFGLLGLAVTWQLGKYLAGGPGGLLAITLSAFSPWHLFVSGEARYWSLVYLVSVGAILLLIQARESDRWVSHGAAGVVLIIGGLTHPTFLFVLIGIAGASLIEPTLSGYAVRWPSRKAILATWLPAGILIGGYLLTLKLTGRGSTLSNWSGRGWLATLRLLPAMVQLATPSLVTAGAIGAVASLLWGSIRAKRFVLLTVGGTITGTGLLLLASLRTDVYADYGVSLLPLGIGAATCILLLPGISRVGPVACALSLVLASAMAPEMVSQLSDGMRYDYRAAFTHIERHGLDRPVLTWPTVIQQYYAPELRAAEFRRTVAQLDSMSVAVPAFWVVTSQDRQGVVGDSGRTLASWFARHCSEATNNARLRFDYREYRVVSYLCHGQATNAERVSSARWRSTWMGGTIASASIRRATTGVRRPTSKSSCAKPNPGVR